MNEDRLFVVRVRVVHAASVEIGMSECQLIDVQGVAALSASPHLDAFPLFAGGDVVVGEIVRMEENVACVECRPRRVRLAPPSPGHVPHSPIIQLMAPRG